VTYLNPRMKENQPTIQPLTQFKTYPKNEEANETYTSRTKLMKKGSRLVHQMNLKYDSISYEFAQIQSKSLQTPLEKLKIINTLSLFFQEADSQNHMILKNISMKLKPLSSLQHIKLQFFYSTWPSVQDVVHLASALAQMKLLKKLALDFIYSPWINDESLHLLFQSLKKHKHLQSLDLDLSKCLNITEKSFQYLASTFKRSLQSLKELRLKLTSVDFTKRSSLELLASGLTSIKDLQNLIIDFSQLEISEETNFPSFMSSTKHLKSLRILSMDFSSLPITETAFKNLATSFPSLIHLHTLFLYFQFNETLTVCEMEALAEGLQSLASSLKNLTLNLTYSQNLDDQALEKLADGLKGLTNLSDFRLQCSNCSYVGDAGVESVSCALGGLPNLESVILNFRGCCPIENIYCEDLKMKKNIKTLIFNYNKVY